MEDNILTTIIMPMSLFLIMVGLGLSLTVEDFKRVLQFPKAIIIGLTNQLLLLPIIAFGIVLLYDPPPLMAVGIMLIAACPGGPLSNLITHVSKGDVALSISLTACASLVTVFTIPILTTWSTYYFLSQEQSVVLPILPTVGRVLMITLLPAGIGMLIKHRYPLFAHKMDRPGRIASTVLYVLIIIGIMIANRENLVEEVLRNGTPTVTLNIITMFLGYQLATFFGLNLRQKISISIESGIQNGTLAIVIAASILDNIIIGIPAAVYGLAMFVSGGLMMWTFGRRKEKPFDKL